MPFLVSQPKTNMKNRSSEYVENTLPDAHPKIFGRVSPEGKDMAALQTYLAKTDPYSFQAVEMLHLKFKLSLFSFELNL